MVGLVLAGGGGRRLGGAVKADLLVGGRRLVDRVANVLGRNADPVLIAAGAFRPGRIAGAPGLARLPDAVPGRGPAGGLLALLAWAEAQAAPPDLVAVSAVDTPFLPQDFAAAARDALGGAGVVFVRYRGRDHPTSALWRREALAAALSLLPGDARKGSALRALVAAAGGVPLAVWDEAAHDPFAGVNTVADLVAANRRAAVSR